MSPATLHLTGLSRADEAALRALFEQAQAQLQPPWRLVPEAEAATLLIDTDSIYGQMALMQAIGSGRCLIALTEGARADTDHLLRKPVSVASLVAMLNSIAAETLLPEHLPTEPSPPAVAEPLPAAMPAASAPSVATAASVATAVAPEPTPQPTPAPAVVAAQADALPAALDLQARYKLERWPQIDRGYPKHFRIATLMLKGAASPAEIAEATGASLAEVCEFIVARLESGHAVKT